MFIEKVEITKLLEILQSFSDEGCKYISLSIEDTPKKHIIKVHPVKEGKVDKPDPDSFNSDNLIS